MKKLFFLLIVSLCMQGLFAQRHSVFILSYPIAFPMGDLKDYISNTSFRGINLEFGKEVRPNLIAEIEVTTGPSVFRSPPDFDVQFVHPLPRHEFFKTTRTAHALLNAREVPRNSLGILRLVTL